MKNLSNKLLTLIQQLQNLDLPANFIIDIEKWIHHNEYGVAFDFVVSYLEDNDIVIDTTIYNCIVDLAKDMGIPEEEYIYIKRLINL
jgi:predicted membrane protein